MPIDRATALAQIDAVFRRREELMKAWCPESVQEVTTLARATIAHLAPQGSVYLDQMERVFRTAYVGVATSKEKEVEGRLQGILRALRAAYEAGLLVDSTTASEPA